MPFGNLARGALGVAQQPRRMSRGETTGKSTAYDLTGGGIGPSRNIISRMMGGMFGGGNQMDMPSRGQGMWNMYGGGQPQMGGGQPQYQFQGGGLSGMPQREYGDMQRGGMGRPNAFRLPQGNQGFGAGSSPEVQQIRMDRMMPGGNMYGGAGETPTMPTPIFNMYGNNQQQSPMMGSRGFLPSWGGITDSRFRF